MGLITEIDFSKIEDIAEKHGKSPKEIYEIFCDVLNQATTMTYTENAPLEMLDKIQNQISEFVTAVKRMRELNIDSIGSISENPSLLLNKIYMNTENIAQVAHEINKSFCESIGDHSQKSWEEAEQWQRDSAIKGVAFALNNPDAPPSAQHEAWMADKEKDGWKHGPVKNPETKEHPCMVPYDQLPVEQRSKDYLFKQVVHSLKKFITENQSGETGIIGGEGLVSTE